MKQVLVVNGQVTVEEVPAPRVEPGTVVVEVHRSCISVGTEMSGIAMASTPLWKRALRDPAKVAAAVRLVAEQGVSRGRRVITGQLAASTPIGYSASGVIVAVGRGVDDLAAGDRVACAGAGVANHAELVRVPRNLVAPVPDAIHDDAACTVTLGAIALQGVRRAEPTLGETFVVVGLGILGQLTVQILKANGCRVVASDVDPSRIDLAVARGADAPASADDGSLDDRVRRLTAGIGADGVIITASTPSDDVVSTAFRMCRKKGRVVLVGDVGLALDRTDFYAKELDFRISTSYGPGRYDRRYEDEGADYPVGYVRWTENRNMEEYLRLVADGKVSVGDLVAAVHDVDEAPHAYEALKAARPQQPLVLLRYPVRPDDARSPARVSTHQPVARGGSVRVALVGAGSFARTAHLPNLAALGRSGRLHGVVSRTGSVASDVARQYGAAWSSTDPDQAFGDPDVDAVLIATRHDDHGSLVIRALDAGKHVLVEKPLALTLPEVDAIANWYAERKDTEVPLLLTGYNRRFSPTARRLRSLVERRAAPMVLTYRMNAGYLPGDHWVHGPQGGGRNLGEACHAYDLFTFLVSSPTEAVTASAIKPISSAYRADDNFVMTARFADGSVASLAYTSLGSTVHPKEQLEVFSDGRVLVLDDYRSLSVVGATSDGVSGGAQDKGHEAELAAFLEAVQRGGRWPIPLDQQLQSARMALDVQRAIAPES